MKEDLLQIINYFSITGFTTGGLVIVTGLIHEAYLITFNQPIPLYTENLIYTGTTLSVLSIILLTLPSLWKKITS